MPLTTLGPFAVSSTTALAVAQGGVAWANTGNVVTEDDAGATAQGFDDPTTDEQAWRATTTGTIPSNGTIESITIRVRARRTAGTGGTINVTLWADSTGSLGAILTSEPGASSGTITGSFANYDITIPKSAILSQTNTRNAWNSGAIWPAIQGVGPAGGATFSIDTVSILSLVYSTPTQTYNRPKSVVTNSTDINFTVKASESPNAVADLPNPGNTGIVEVLYQADADETGGSDVQAIAKFVFTPVLAADGGLSLQVDFTPVKGDGTFGSTQSSSVSHLQNMSAWQTQAGRAPQA